ncbi:MAG TPA: hypothetical protein VJN89_08150 [Candidatus Acidoferrum sp.]|nr:hypothetical protein [Candidatus Acidoferrum sp.]
MPHMNKYLLPNFTKFFEVRVKVEKGEQLLSKADIRAPRADVERAQATDELASHQEAFKLVERVFLLAGCEAPHVVAFCGVDENTAAARICARTGEILARHTNSEVCLVDGNPQAPGLHECFDADNVTGLANASLEPGQIRSFVQPLNGGKLFLLTAGSHCTENGALWDSEQIPLRLAELRSEFSYVLVNAPPVNRHIGATLFGRMSEGVVLVLESNQTLRETARKAKEDLEAAGVRLFGAVFTNRKFPIPETIYKKLVTGFSGG